MKNILLLGYLSIYLSAMGQTPAFELSFLQNGKVVPVENHQIALEKEMFTIVISVKNAEGIFVSASFDTNLFAKAENGNHLNQLGEGSNVMSEENFNVEKELLISTNYNCYWFYDSNLNWHRFNEVVNMENGFNGFKVIEKLWDKESEHTMMISKITIPIYLVFLLGDQNEDYSLKNEYQRDYVKIIWK